MGHIDWQCFRGLELFLFIFKIPDYLLKSNKTGKYSSTCNNNNMKLVTMLREQLVPWRE